LPFFRPARNGLFIGLALFFFLLLFAEIVFLPSLLPYDFALHQWLQDQRTCDWHFWAFNIKDWTTSPLPLLGYLLLVSGFLAYRRHWDLLTAFLVTVAGGALLCEWLKFIIARPRPSALPFATIGSSFPSGHVTNTLIVLGAASYFISQAVQLNGWLVRSLMPLSVILTLLIAAQRLYFTHHWLTDVLASFFLGIGWLFLSCAAARRKLSLRASLASLATFGVAMLLVRHILALPLKLPSALNSRGEPLARIDFDPSRYTPTNRAELLEMDRTWKMPVRLLNAQETSFKIDLPAIRDHLLSFAFTIPGQKF
jgi:membrane-associated phospholipid phosphatase